MRILKVFALRGPNIWSRNSVLEVWVDLGEWKESSAQDIPGFSDRLKCWLPSLAEHRPGTAEQGGFLRQLNCGTNLAQVLERTTLELETLAGTPVGEGRGRVQATPEAGISKIGIRYQEEALGRACLETAHELLMAAVRDVPFSISEHVTRLHELAERVCLGPSTMAIVEAARVRNIPARRLNAGSLVQFGHGAKRRRIWTAESDTTSAIAESIAQDKQLTKSMLKACGVPVPEGRMVSDAHDAWEAAQGIAAPVVVKPVDANHGRGVFMDLTEEEQVKTAYQEALKEGSAVIVERFAHGHEHRLLVVGNRLVAAAAGEAATVTGDGEHSIRDLIDLQVNSDPRRGDDESQPLNLIRLEPLTIVELSRQGFTPDSIPASGVKVTVRRHDSLSREVTELVHPSIADHAVTAAQAVGLDIAGIDMVVEDISRPLEDQGGVIVEVNAGPGLLMHLKPSVGQPQPVGAAIVDHLFPEPSEDGRVPIVLVTGTVGQTTCTRMVYSILRAAGFHAGMACSTGVVIQGRTLENGDCAGPESARNVLLNPLVTAAVFEAATAGILGEGLGVDQCDVALVTNSGNGDSPGMSERGLPDEMFLALRTPVEAVLPTGSAVLNATDSQVVQMSSLSGGGVIFYAPDPEHPVIRSHRAAGKRTAVVRDGQVVLCDGDHETAIATLDELPATVGGRGGLQVENVLAAAATGWALGIEFPTIVAGLKSFPA